MKTPIYYLNESFFRQLIDKLHLAHDDFALELGVSRSHWSTILNGHQPLSKRMRRKLLESQRLQGINVDDLWRIETEDACAA